MNKWLPVRLWLLATLTIVSAVAIMRYLNSGIGYANGPGCDSWYFFGIYDNYRALLAQRPFYQFYRYPALLPWIYVAPHMSTIHFHELKFWTYFVASAGLFGYVSIRLFERQVGVLIAVLFACSALLLGALSTDFVTGAGIVWECAVIAATIAGSRSERQPLWGTSAGILYALCVFTHLPTVMFIFPLPLLLLTAPSRSLADLVRFHCWAALGFVAATLLMGAYSVSIGNAFVFFREEALATIVVAQPRFYARPLPVLADWFAGDSNIPLDLAAVGCSVISILLLIARGLSIETLRRAIPMIVFLLVVGLCFAWELSDRIVLQENVFAPWLYPTTFLALGSVLCLAMPVRSEVAFGIVVAGALVSLTWSGTRHDMISYQWRFAIVGGAIVALTLSRWRPAGVGAVTGVIALVATTHPTFHGSIPWLDVTNAQRLYVQTRAGADFVNRYKGARYPKFWMSLESATTIPELGRNMSLLVPMTVPRSFQYCQNFPASFPNITHRDGTFDANFQDLTATIKGHLLESGDRLFVIAPSTDLAEQATAALKSVGFKAALIDAQDIGSGIAIAAFNVSAL